MENQLLRKMMSGEFQDMVRNKIEMLMYRTRQEIPPPTGYTPDDYFDIVK